MSVAIIDYGSGNLRSAAKAFCWAAVRADHTPEVRVTADPDDLVSAERIVLPGVGAFADCMRGLEAVSGLREALQEQVIRRGKPFLGICVGMQLMARSGHEHGVTDGLGWLPGGVVEVAPGPGPNKKRLKVPHMGWNQLVMSSHRHPVLEGLDDGCHVYFVHSFHMRPDSPDHIVATTDYGESVTAAVARDNIVGTQFHPEKSQAAGLRLISNFLSWRP